MHHNRLAAGKYQRFGVARCQQSRHQLELTARATRSDTLSTQGDGGGAAAAGGHHGGGQPEGRPWRARGDAGGHAPCQLRRQGRPGAQQLLLPHQHGAHGRPVHARHGAHLRAGASGRLLLLCSQASCRRLRAACCCRARQGLSMANSCHQHLQHNRLQSRGH